MIKQSLRNGFNKRVNKDFKRIIRTEFKDDLLILRFKEKLDKTSISTTKLISMSLLEMPFLTLFNDYIEEFRPELENNYRPLFDQF